MKHEVLQMLKCIDENPRKVKLMISILEKSTISALGKQKFGRKRMNLEYCIAGIMYYLRTNCGWRRIPKVFGNYKTIYGWYVKISKIRVFSRSFGSLIKWMKKQRIVSLKRLIIDGSLITTNNGGELAKRNPRNHNKNTINRIVVSNGKGMPIYIGLAPGTRHDTNLLKPALNYIAKVYRLPKKFYMHGDKGFDSFDNRMAISKRGGTALIPVRNHGFIAPYIKGKDSRRWVIERTNAWFNRFKVMDNSFIRNMDRLFECCNLAGLLILSRFISSPKLKKLIGILEC